MKDFFSVESNGEGPRSKFERENGQTDGQKWPKISGDDAARPAWVTGARRQQFAAASRFWSIPNLMPHSTVTRAWLTEWAHLGQLCGTLTSDNLFFFCRFVSIVWQDSDRVQSVTQGSWYSGRSSMLFLWRAIFDVILRFLVDRYRRTKPLRDSNPMHRSSLFQRDFKNR